MRQEQGLLIGGIGLILVGVIGLALEAAWLESALTAGSAMGCGNAASVCVAGSSPGDWTQLAVVVTLSVISMALGGLLFARLARRMPRHASA